MKDQSCLIRLWFVILIGIQPNALVVEGQTVFDVLSGVLDSARTIRSIAASMTVTLSDFVNKASEVVASRSRGMGEVSGGDRPRFNFFTNSDANPTRYNHSPRFWDVTPDSYRVEFVIFNRKKGSSRPQKVDLSNVTQTSEFDKRKFTKLIIHDYNQTYSDPLLMELAEAYLRKGDFNVIIVDWVQARRYSYTVAAKVTEVVGVKSARMLMELDADYGKVHAIGFGLGAHAAGVLGSELQGRLRRITGLDPSLPLFRMSPDSQRLDADDAIFVDVIHSDGGDNFWYANHLGMGQAMGKVDVYLNRGIFQPGCPSFRRMPSYEDMYCSHIRSLQVFIESVRKKENVIGCECDSWSDFQAIKCDCTVKVTFMGDSCPKKARGKFFLITADKPPYGLGRSGAFPSPTVDTKSFF